MQKKYIYGAAGVAFAAAAAVIALQKNEMTCEEATEAYVSAMESDPLGQNGTLWPAHDTMTQVCAAGQEISYRLE